MFHREDLRQPPVAYPNQADARFYDELTPASGRS
jgi:hypothetical protein